MRILLGSFVVMLLSSVPAAAEEHVPVPPGPEIQGLVDALENDDREVAISAIKGIFALNDKDRFVRTPREFTDLVIGCPSQQVSANIGEFLKLYTYRWDCPDGQYQANLSKDPESSYVEVVDPADEARLAERLTRPALRPLMVTPLPVVESAEERLARLEDQGLAELAILQALEPHLRNGRLANSSSVEPKANFTTGYRDFAQNTFVTEMDGDGLAAANEQLDWLTENLGQPETAECQQKRHEIGAKGYFAFFSSCTVKSERAGNGYTAIILFRDTKIASIQFNYMNRDVFEKNREFLTKRIQAN